MKRKKKEKNIFVLFINSTYNQRIYVHSISIKRNRIKNAKSFYFKFLVFVHIEKKQYEYI
jgi:hypothetical protein